MEGEGKATRSTIGHHISLNGPILGQDGVLLSYYEKVISPMISTTQVQNGFSSTLLPMALSSRDAPALALLNAMMAVSMIHHSTSAADAMTFKSNAVRSLSNSLRTSPASAPTIEVQLAAVMMLCVYDVFDREEGNWHIHLSGAKEIVRRQCFTDKHDRGLDFLLTWWLYHDVLAAFNKPSWGERDQSSGSNSASILRTFKGDKSLIVGSLGCSVEVLETIDECNWMRLPPSQRRASTSLTQRRHDLETKLRYMRQRLDPIECSDSSRERRILAIAELYRLATFLYLYRVHPFPEDGITRCIYVQQALKILEDLEVATSPWPIFVIACEVGDQERVNILHTLDLMDNVRNIGNIKVLRDIVESIWKQQDLRNTSHTGQRMDWLQFVECDVPVPWFI
ncbi:hypothetical protein F53441_11572 [Fusarium austroafricanum]|uniref:Uncharacterized protein n=1 Tax=Fusarium austroafricanum TaxID=2364996 RepID=A0A8H4K527_9HYPO|nr:hypothetical protein F53441_11572 [Fusarium austroafricanum]